MDSQQKPRPVMSRNINWRTRNKRKKPENNESVNDDTKKATGKIAEKDRRERILVKGIDIQQLPVPVPQQLKVLTNLLNLVHTKHGMVEQDSWDRKHILQRFQHLFNEEIQGGHLRLCGSSVSCLGLKTSDVNIDIYEVDEAKVPKLFIGFLNILKNSDDYSDVKDEFQSNTPAINFIDIKSGLTCRIRPENQSTFLTTNLLNIYGELDDRVKPLCVAFKLWAKICKVDSPACGTLPSYSFILMLVHFLQQTNPPVLPVIHEMLDNNSVEKCIETQHSTQDFLTKMRSKWKTLNTECLGSLWLQLLRYYSKDDETLIVNLRYSKKCLRSSRRWGKKRFAIEDPFSIKRNVARTLTKNTYHRYIVEHLKVALLYFGKFPGSVPTVDQHIASEIRDDPSEIRDDPNEITENIRDISNEDEEKRDDSSSDSDKEYEEDDEEDDLLVGVFAMDNINTSPVNESDDSDDTTVNHVKPSQDKTGMLSGIPEPTTSMVDHNDLTSIEYTFDDSVLRKGPALDSVCSFCGEDGHIVDNCRAEEKTVLQKLPELTNWFKEMLNTVCVCCADDFGINNEEVRRRRHIMSALEAYIRTQFPYARLHMFGSSCNGFGFRESDLDICMKFEGRDKNDMDCIAVITSLAKLLRLNPECGEVIAITGAKVPIVKFFLKKPKLEADISLYNEVALSNTRLLAAYVQIDKRVHILGCTLKIFVKLCDIGDASRGSLSSYAYILMLLHFLQQRRPPVLPVLQELYTSDEIPMVMVDGCNCWFYDDFKNLSSKWRAENSESIGELWLGFLRYYTEVFDFHRHVVCIRSTKLLTKFEKMWNGKKICIEDPFVLSHNLGAGLSLPMAKFILSTLVKARERFGIPRRDIPENGQMRQRFFFDPAILNDGFCPPTGRNCNVCGKIGHWARECPYNRLNRGEGKNQRKKNAKDKEKIVEKSKVQEDGKNVGNMTLLPTGHQAAVKDDIPRPSNVIHAGNPRENMIPLSPPVIPIIPHVPPSFMRQSPNQRGPPSFPVSPNFMFPTTRPLVPRFPQSPNSSAPRLRIPGVSTGQRIVRPPPLMSGNGFVMNSPPFCQPFSSPPRQNTAIGSPVPPSRYADMTPVMSLHGGLLNNTPRMLTCEDLESHINGIQGGEHPNPGINDMLPQSVIQSLQSLNMDNDNHFGTSHNPFSQGGRLNETTDVKEHLLFSTPPNIQNVAGNSLCQNIAGFPSSLTTNLPNRPLSQAEQNSPREVGEKVVIDIEKNHHEMNAEKDDKNCTNERLKEQTSTRSRPRRNRKKKRNNEYNEATTTTDDKKPGSSNRESGGQTPTSGKNDTTGGQTPTSGKKDTTGGQTPTSGKKDTTGGQTPTSGKKDTTGGQTPTSGKKDTNSGQTPTSGKKDTRQKQTEKQNYKKQGSPNKDYVRKYGDSPGSGLNYYRPQPRKGDFEKKPGTPNKESGQRPASGRKEQRNDKKQGKPEYNKTGKASENERKQIRDILKQSRGFSKQQNENTAAVVKEQHERKVVVEDGSVNERRRPIKHGVRRIKTANQENPNDST